MEHPIFHNSQFCAPIVLALFDYAASDMNLGPAKVGLPEDISDPRLDGFNSDVLRLRDLGYLTFAHASGGTAGETHYFGVNLTERGLDGGRMLTATS